MTDDNDRNVRQGELLPGGRKELVTEAKPSTFRQLFSFTFKWAWVNHLRERGLRSFTNVIRAENELMDAMREHDRKADELRGIATILETDRAERKALEFEAKKRLADAERAYRERYQDNTIAQKQKDHHIKRLDIEDQKIERERLEEEKRRLEVEKQIDELLAPPEPPPKVRKTARGRSEKQKRIERARKRYDRELERIEAMAASPETKTALRQAANIEYEEEVERIVHTPES
jgi:hypothetical protein